MRVHVYEPVPRRGTGRGGLPVAVDTGTATTHRSFEVRPMGAGRHRLELSGAFDWRWADPLCRGLARARIAVRRGFAIQLGDGLWRAAFELEAASDGADPVLLDYLELVSRGARPGFADRVALTSYDVAESSRHDGSLLLEVSGPDRTGFLGGLLERLGFLGLAAVEMRVWTDENGVDDRFYVKQRDGGVPSRRTAKLLAEALEGRLLR